MRADSRQLSAVARRNRKRHISLGLTAASIAALLLSATACGGDKQPTLDLTIDPETTPTMLTHDVSTLISDSGITRYHITSPIWYVYDEASEPRWAFPQGVFLEKFDNNLKQEATVEADSATYFEKRHLWRLDGNVRIKNVQSEKFLTEQLFWDQRQQKIYSDSFIHIERADRVIEGYGFESNDRLSVYEVKRVSGIFPVSQFTARDEADGDSAATAPRYGRPGGPVSLGPAPVIGHPGVSTAADTAAAFAPRVITDTTRGASGRRKALDLRTRQRARHDSAATAASGGAPHIPGSGR